MLDIKLKSNKNKYIINASIFLLLIALAVGMYSTYTFIKEQAKKYEYNIFERDSFLSDLNTSNYGIYFDTLKNKENNTLKPSDVLIDTEGKSDDSTQENIKYIKEEFDRNIYRYQEALDSRLKNLDYYAINKANNLVKERNNQGISSLLVNNPDSNIIEQLNNKYSFYTVIDYNENGDMSIKNIYGSDKLIVTDNLKNNKIDNSYNNTEIKPIKNMTYIYAIPRELQYEDSISRYKMQSKIHSYNMASSDFVNPAIILVLIIGLIIPYKLSKELIGFDKIKKIPVEIISIIFICTVVVTLNEMTYYMVSSTLENELINLAPIVVSEATINTLEIMVNILFWIISFGVIFIATVLLKHILSIGIRQYIRESSLTYKILRSIWRSNKKIYNYLINIDLKNKENKKLAGLLGINLLILCIMSSVWFFGIFIAIIYTIVLFKLITKHYRDISDKYNKLFEATNRIAEGNLEVNVEEDLGVFNDLKLELQNIQNGFKKAVNEEVKSQRMKTELITNVSHDLKTPLTSIITYVDLLKDEKLSLDKRREYLDTLDRKSQRLKDLIEDLFEVSKANSGNISLNIDSVDVVSLMKQTLLEVDDKISKASLVVKTNYPEEKVILPLDSQRMFRVFENLIINITKYALEGSRVYIDIINSSDKVEIILRNMASNEINFNVSEIMERFVRGDKARNTEGSGLGLAIAKSFVEIQGGKLDIIVDGDLFKVLITFNKIN